MTDSELKKLKDDLWHSADMLRAGAHLAANKYGQPILGLIFLRYADILFKQHKDEIVCVFKDIPETISIDLFGEIYEYFLGNFALGEEARRLEGEILGDGKRIFK